MVISNHFLCKDWEKFIQLKQPFINGCLGFQVLLNSSIKFSFDALELFFRNTERHNKTYGIGGMRFSKAKAISVSESSSRNRSCWIDERQQSTEASETPSRRVRFLAHQCPKLFRSLQTGVFDMATNGISCLKHEKCYGDILD